MITHNTVNSRMRHMAAQREIDRLMKIQPEVWALLRLQINSRQPRLNYVHDNINKRVVWLNAITALSEPIASDNGPHVGIEVWQRDCDCAEWTSFDVIKADVKVMEKYVNDLYANAEGPLSFRWRRPRDRKSFRSQRRDRVMEAFENGNNYSV